MKYINKLFMLLAVTAFFAACSDDDSSWNTNADVTVSMAQTEVRVKEGAGLFNVPVAVTGETNAPVKVNVSVRESGSNPATKDVNYMVTDTTIYVSGTTANVEIKTVDDDEINEDRTFEVYIVSAEGAKLGSNTSTTVVLRDNDSEFYEKLQGNWTMTCLNSSGAKQTWSVTIEGATSEDDEDYNNKLYLYGMMGYSWTCAELYYSYDKSTNTGSLSFDNLGNYYFAEGVNFGLGGSNNVIPYNMGTSSYTTTPIEGSWSSDFKSVTFDQNATLALLIFNEDGSFTRYSWNRLSKLALSR